jgi:hypothetical protein
MADSKTIISDVWPVWEFECPECQKFIQIEDSEFGPHDAVSYDEAAEFRCQCGAEYVVKKPEI